MAGHRYWRLNCQSGQNSYYSVSELALHTSIGGANVVAGGVAIASSYYGNQAGFQPSNAFDNNGATWWNSQTHNAGEWIGYDFGAGVTKDIVEITILSRNDVDCTQAPLTGNLEWSDDGSAWISYGSFSTTTWGQAQTRTFTFGSGLALLETATLNQYAAEGPPAGTLYVDTLNQYVAEGIANSRLVVDTLNQYVAEGVANGRLIVDVLNMYVIEGPPGLPARRRFSFVTG